MRSRAVSAPSNANFPGRSTHDIDALHRSRVASRRLREILPVLGLDRRAGGDARRREAGKRVRRVTRALGSVRELDVALGILDEVERALPGAGRGGGGGQGGGRGGPPVAPRGDGGRNSTDIQAQTLAGDLASLEESVGQEPAATRSASLRRRLERRVDRLDAAIEAAGALYAFDRLHMVRIAVKQLRYTLELIHEFGRVPTRRLVTRLRRFQDLLGRQHDLEVVAGYVRRLRLQRERPVRERRRAGARRAGTRDQGVARRVPRGRGPACRRHREVPG